MPKRKYTRMNEQPKGYECSNKKCKWTGTDEQKGKSQVDKIVTVYVCPKCGNDSFYGLLETPKVVK